MTKRFVDEVIKWYVRCSALTFASAEVSCWNIVLGLANRKFIFTTTLVSDSIHVTNRLNLMSMTRLTDAGRGCRSAGRTDCVVGTRVILAGVHICGKKRNQLQKIMNVTVFGYLILISIYLIILLLRFLLSCSTSWLRRYIKHKRPCLTARANSSK